MTNSNSVYKNIFFLGIAFILMGLISHNAFKNGKVVCESYIMNTYLYIANQEKKKEEYIQTINMLFILKN